ncbi:ABATE domain-containing protein [Micromonospora sp. C28SCA-DRY-2]|uniref:CGNR zinc finger domain-containing protein n=1 Tax=Micromonospora sp. C28SCA-DRY-2 TaxID=3059522 RepID=UPI0026755A61|nr:ABATE domain-containing protein [Micromonospora sp. C28SCA-DRY-2]MDO3703176.1 ABATE domain-containing protein [Micromonospora sp. C28SCA-DRY-2]
MFHNAAAFPFVGGRVSVDFTATYGLRWRDPGVERIPAPADLARWFTEAGLTDTTVPVSTPTLRGARELREALYRLMRGRVFGEPPDRRAVDVVNRWAAKAPPAIRLTADGAATRLVEPTAGALLALVARDGVDLLGGSHAGRLRECSSDTCTLLYLDTSRAGSRRWCAMAVCGSRDKMTRYRRRAAGR